MKTELSSHYSLRALALAAIPTIGMMIITSIYSVVDGYFVSNYAGKTEFAAMNIICGCMNIALDALFIIVFGWGLTGAAIATAIALATGGIYPLLLFGSRRNTTHLQFVRVGRIDWESIGKSCSNGLSEYVGNVAFNVVGIAYNLQLMRFIGENGVSAYGIIMYVGFIFGAVFIGYNLCVSQFIAFHFGAGNRKELKSLLRKSLTLIGLAGIAMTAVAEIAAYRGKSCTDASDSRPCNLVRFEIV